MEKKLREYDHYLIIIFIPAGFGLRSIIRALRGQEKCECPGDCSHCRIQCQSNEKYYGVKKEEQEN